MSSTKNKTAHTWKLLFRTIKYDLVQGFAFTKKRYLLLAAFILFFNLYITKRVGYFEKANHISLALGFWDYLFQIFQGMPASFLNNRLNFFELPAMWILFHFYLVFCMNGYLQNERKEYGQQILLRTGNRSTWWLGKCCWYVFGTGIYYGITVVITAVFAVFHQGFQNSLFLQTQDALSNLNVNGLNGKNMFFIILLMPFLLSAALGLFQMLLSAILEPITAMLAVSVILAVSGYFCSPLLPGNYLMLMRLSEISGENIRWQNGILYGTLSALLIIAAGIIYFKKTDMYGIERKSKYGH